MHILGLIQIWPSPSIAAMLLLAEHATKALVAPVDSGVIKQILATRLGLRHSSVASTRIIQMLPLSMRLRRLGLIKTRHFYKAGMICLRRFSTPTVTTLASTRTRSSTRMIGTSSQTMGFEGPFLLRLISLLQFPTSIMTSHFWL
jgi:hypothetical protein